MSMFSQYTCKNCLNCKVIDAWVKCTHGVWRSREYSEIDGVEKYAYRCRFFDPMEMPGISRRWRNRATVLRRLYGKEAA